MTCLTLSEPGSETPVAQRYRRPRDRITRHQGFPAPIFAPVRVSLSNSASLQSPCATSNGKPSGLGDERRFARPACLCLHVPARSPHGYDVRHRVQRLSGGAPRGRRIFSCTVYRSRRQLRGQSHVNGRSIPERSSRWPFRNPSRLTAYHTALQIGQRASAGPERRLGMGGGPTTPAYSDRSQESLWILG
ncbi:hypothetical protein BC628DRAFT_20203 [Trametes gibbosa]|nr:hypothetical protein BC628DRAFT_20203 [Trametes gibbosa]